MKLSKTIKSHQNCGGREEWLQSQELLKSSRATEVIKGKLPTGRPHSSFDLLMSSSLLDTIEHFHPTRSLGAVTNIRSFAAATTIRCHDTANIQYHRERIRFHQAISTSLNLQRVLQSSEIITVVQSCCSRQRDVKRSLKAVAVIRSCCDRQKLLRL